jgi:ribosome biogenesis GTPase A
MKRPVYKMNFQRYFFLCELSYVNTGHIKYKYEYVYSNSGIPTEFKHGFDTNISIHKTFLSVLNILSI